MPILMFSVSLALFSLFALGAYAIGDWPLAVYATIGLFFLNAKLHADDISKPMVLLNRPMLGALMIFFILAYISGNQMSLNR